MAVTEADCRAILDACEANNTIFAVCHVLRYTAHVKTIADLIQSGCVCVCVCGAEAHRTGACLS